MPRANYGPGLSAEPNKSGRWEITWTEEGRSRRLSTGETSRKKATIFFAGWLQEREAGTPANVGLPLTVAELVKFYRTNHAEKNVSDIERIDNASKPITAYFGRKRPADLDDTVFTDYADRRNSGHLGRAVSDGTVRRELEHLRAVLLFAVRNRKRTHITQDMVPSITMPPKSHPRTRVATDDEMDRLMEAAQRGLWQDGISLTRAYRFMALARWSGGRKRSIETLTWQRVDLIAGTIDFREVGLRITSKRRVLIPIDAKLMPILKRAWSERVSDFVLDDAMPIRKEFEKAAERAGLPDITPHVFRHTWGTQAAERGLSAYVIATFLGDTTATVEANYMHRSPDFLRKALYADYGR